MIHGYLLQVPNTNMQSPSNSLLDVTSIDHCLSLQNKKLGMKELHKRRELLASLVEKLPVENRSILEYLFKFLREVTKYESKNKMGAQNLSIVFTPNLLRAKFTRVENMMLSGGVALVAQAIENGTLDHLE